MEYPIGSEKFQYFVETLQTTQSPEDILEAVEELTGESLKDIDAHEIELCINVVTKRTFAWIP